MASLQQCSGINKTGERRGERCGQSKRSTHPYFCARHATQQHPLPVREPSGDDDPDSSMPSPDARDDDNVPVVSLDHDASVAVLLEMLQKQMSLRQNQNQNQTRPMPVPAPTVVTEPVVRHNIRVPEPVVYDTKQIDTFIKQQKEHHLQQEVDALRKQHRAKMVRLSGLLRDVEVAANNMCESIFQFKNAIDDDDL